MQTGAANTARDHIQSFRSEIGGGIDHGRGALRFEQPHATIAGQSAPSPGNTLIRGGVELRMHDAILQEYV